MVILCHYTLSLQPLSPPSSEVFSDVFMCTEYLKEKKNCSIPYKKATLACPVLDLAALLELSGLLFLLNCAMKYNFGKFDFYLFILYFFYAVFHSDPSHLFWCTELAS